MRSLQAVVKRYRNLFAQESEQDNTTDEAGTDGIDVEATFSSHWGWLETVDDLAKGEREKWEYFLKMNIIEFLNEMAFRKDRKKQENELITKLIKGKTADEAHILLISYLISKR